MLLFDQLARGLINILGQEHCLERATWFDFVQQAAVTTIKAANYLRRTLRSHCGSQILFQLFRKLRVAFGALVGSERLDRRAEKFLIALSACADKINEKIGPGHDHMCKVDAALSIQEWPRHYVQSFGITTLFPLNQQC
ncbi:hypothetical protein LMG27174_01654 [Paraburkholderia rhynchosiae]|uniref:Uncharacterized protein n=1 Tax=Paraburkholderia rhynchosiae TaxID=487049 RepID=A0A6J5AJ34_9BURK|nr:hypothetical protein LMG27174_01654 [Paraburkholderia rhynchosiae]